MINKITSEITTRWGAFGGILGKEFKLSLSPWIQFSPSTQEQTTENWWTECVAGSHWARFTVWELSCTQTHPTDSNSGRRPSSKLVRHLTGLASISVSIGSTQQLIWIWSLCPLPFSISFLLSFYSLSKHTKKNHFNICMPSISSGVLLFLGWIELAEDCKTPRMISASWDETVHHSMTYVTVSPGQHQYSWCGTD